MHVRRTLAPIVALIATGALAAGCAAGSGSAAPSADAPAEGAGTPTGEITFWSAIPGMDKVTEAFNARQDDITVTFEEIPNGGGGGYAKLATAISAGNGPDVAGFEYPQLPQFVSTGAVVPLDEHVSKDTLGEYPESVRNLVTFEDRVYGLPYDATPMVMFYRQDVLDAAGVSIPKTWDEFRAAAEKVRAANPGQYLASFNPNEPAVQAALSWQAGADWFDVEDGAWKVGVDDEASRKVAEYWQGLIDDDLVKVEASFSDEWTADMAGGVTAGVLGASWSAAGIKSRTEANGQAGKWIAATPPSWGDDANAFYGGTSFAITKNSDNPAAAAAFIEFLATDPAAIEARGDVGSAYLAFPGLNEVAQGVFPTDYFAGDLYGVYDEAIARVSDDWAWGPNFDITNTALKDAMSAVGAGGSLVDAYATAQKKTVDGLTGLGLDVTE
ncbi:ABC transporter substrate-binding protein [Microbacterium resistens]